MKGKGGMVRGGIGRLGEMKGIGRRARRIEENKGKRMSTVKVHENYIKAREDKEDKSDRIL